MLPKGHDLLFLNRLEGGHLRVQGWKADPGGMSQVLGESTAPCPSQPQGPWVLAVLGQGGPGFAFRSLPVPGGRSWAGVSVSLRFLFWKMGVGTPVCLSSWT